ncbi:VOC family protein [Kribbella sp. NPDC051620]|uniref:VOC family protein n=1 Tax=Kribbella sp. NPDC051620 TaxID=3364120 RepID=UPI003794C018
MAETDGVDGWRVLDGGLSAWFDAPSLRVGAALAGRVVELVGERELPDFDLRDSGVRVRIGVPGSEPGQADVVLAGGISAAALELGMVADPAGLQVMRVAVWSGELPPVVSFWSSAFGYGSVGDERFGDPLRRDPAISFHRLEEPRPLRNRIHVDVSRPSDAVEAFRAAVGQEAFGPWGVALADPDGNEIDLVPGGELTDETKGTDEAATADWRVLFGAMTFYPTTSSAVAGRLAAAVAGLADEAGRSLLVDLRPDGVTIDSGKDQWENDVAGFVRLAARIQSAARELGLSAEPARLRFVQFGIDAVDVAAVKDFWTTVLGYREDPRGWDLYDPRRLNPTFIFQQMDAGESERRSQRNRTQLELLVPADLLESRLDTAVAAGGKILPAERPGTRAVADPEGNELIFLTS